MDAAILFLLFCFVRALEANTCPSKEDMAPCECVFIFGDFQISCKDVFSPQDLISPIRSIAKSKTKVLGLTITDSSLLYLPEDLFKDTHIEKVRFVNTEIMSLTESDFAFKGLEEIMTELRATEAKFISHWDFQQLQNLRELTLIDVHQMILGAVDHPFPNLPELTALGIISAEISYITDSAFSSLPKLRIFDMRNNEIEEMKRNMFPNPANSLAIMDLSQNKLSRLPGDFFDNMPNLESVRLDKNKFIILAEKPFSVMISKVQELAMDDNPFRCDCRMRWLVDHRFPRDFRGECTSPESLAGRTINNLDFKSLRC